MLYIHLKRFRAQPVLAFPLLFLMIALTGCALSPTTSNVQAFGKAARQATAAVSAPDQLQNELLLKIAINRNACRYLSAESYGLASRPANNVLETIKEQKKFVRALEAYSTALSDVTAPEGLANLRAAANSFSDQLSTVVAVGPLSAASATVIGPVTKVLVNAVVNVSELQRRKKMKEIMVTADISIVQGSRKIRQDYKQIQTHLENLAQVWRRSAACVLRQVRVSNGAGAYDLFTQFDADYRAYKAKIMTLNEAVNLIGQVVITHEILINSDGSFDEALAQFNQAIADFGALKAALQTN